LTTALALARNGFRVVVLEQAERLEETGAGIQLSPNAVRTLLDLGLGERLRPHVVVPGGLRVLDARSGREITFMPLGAAAARRYGAPYWSIHRGDLQAALVAGVRAHPDIGLKLGLRVEDFVEHSNGITVSARAGARVLDEHGVALIAADGLWSHTRARLGFGDSPRFAGRAAWRALVPAEDVAPDFREPLIQLWLGSDAHLVHYPVKGGQLINIVAIADDNWDAPGWSEPASRDELLPRFVEGRWAAEARSLLALPETWLKWALYDRPPLKNGSRGAVALLGDAAHPMLPYLAQGAAMAIEDAAMVAQCLAQSPDDPAQALHTYWTVRRARTRKVQRLAARNGGRYHLGGVRGTLRNTAMRLMGGTHLLRHYDWLYDWRLPTALPIN
jgi:salicylate hydroxylase